MIDEASIIKAVQSLGIAGNDEGLIPVFGVYLANMYADYYNNLSFEFIREIEKITEKGMREDAINLLKHAALACGVNTLGGILKSAEWESIVQPMIENDRNKIEGLVAVTNALGWGFWSLKELEEGKRAVFNAYYPYEGLGYKNKYDTSTDGVCYMLQGVAAAMMELVFPRSDREKYYAYQAEETHCVAKGDPHCIIITTRRDD